MAGHTRTSRVEYEPRKIGPVKDFLKCLQCARFAHFSLVNLCIREHAFESPYVISVQFKAILCFTKRVLYELSAANM